MQDIENNNWIILDPLGNIYEIHANLTVMPLLKIIQAELCLNDTFLKSCFLFASIFLDIYENPRRKTFVSPSCLKQPKTTEVKNDIHFYFDTSLHRCHLSEAPKRCAKIKKFMPFSPSVWIGTSRVLILFFSNFQLLFPKQ